VRSLLKNGTWWFVARTMPKTLYELCEIIVWQGPRVVPSLFNAVVDGLRQRGSVKQIQRVGRREVERLWLTPLGLKVGPHAWLRFVSHSSWRATVPIFSVAPKSTLARSPSDWRRAGTTFAC